jgi:hypothetical protein
MVGAIAREICGWKKVRKPKRHVPPADFKSGLDPATGLHRAWNRMTGKVELIEMAPDPQPRRSPAASQPEQTLLGNTVVKQGYGRETPSVQHYMTPSAESSALVETLRKSVPSENTHEELAQYVKAAGEKLDDVKTSSEDVDNKIEVCRPGQTPTAVTGDDVIDVSAQAASMELPGQESRTLFKYVAGSLAKDVEKGTITLDDIAEYTRQNLIDKGRLNTKGYSAVYSGIYKWKQVLKSA